MYHITKDDITWAELRLIKRLGQNARDIASEALFDALRVFDESKGIPFRSFASKHIIYFAMNAQTAFNGKKGSPRTKIESITEHVTAEEPIPVIDNEDEMRDVLLRVDNLDGVPRLSILLRIIGLSVMDTCWQLGLSRLTYDKQSIADIVSSRKPVPLS